MAKRRTLLLVLAFALSTTVAASLGTFAGAAPAVTTAAPANTTPPAITGTAQQGQTLTASPGAWSGDQPITYAFHWLRCDAAGNNCVEIGGATAQTYSVDDTAVGHRLRVQVTATNADGSAGANSAPTAVVSSLAAPVNTAEPSITGSAAVGATLTAVPGTWTGASTLAYQWLQCDAKGAECQAVQGATEKTYVVRAGDVGHTLRVEVTAKNDGGSTAKAANATAVVPEPGPAGAIRLPNGRTSVPASSLSLPDRLIVDRVGFSPNPVRSRGATITVRVHVSDTRGDVVRGALVFVRSTPLVTSGMPEQATSQDGWVTFRTNARRGFPSGRGNVQFFVRARKAGGNLLAGISTRRLVQISTR